MGKRYNLMLERIKAGYDRQDLFAEKCNTSGANISNIESGKRKGSYETWLSIQKVLNKTNAEMWDLYLIQEDKWKIKSK